jgi:FKBP-type peptidyl-prolyl cis-trans isomerase 2
MKKLLALFALGILLLGCVGPEPEPEAPTAYYGDTVTIDYILYVDGKTVDTSIEQVARDEGIYSIFRTYQPLTFELELGEVLIDGFVKGIVGMKVNESKVFTVPPGPDAYGYYDPTRVYNVSRYYKFDALEEVPRSYFEGRNITLEVGAGFDTDIGTVFIENMTNDTVTIMYIFQPGDSFNYNGFHHVVVSGTDENVSYTIMFDVRENATYYTTSLIDGEPVRVKVTKLTNDTITFDENHDLAGEELVYNVTLLDLVKAE